MAEVSQAPDGDDHHKARAVSKSVFLRHTPAARVDDLFYLFIYLFMYFVCACVSKVTSNHCITKFINVHIYINIYKDNGLRRQNRFFVLCRFLV